MLTGRDAAHKRIADMLDKGEKLPVDFTNCVIYHVGPVAIEAIKNNKSAYLTAVGGAAYLVAKAIKSAKVVGFADLGMEAIYEFDVENMPVTVAVDSSGVSVHDTGPKEWQARIGKIPVVA
jgi:fumarate hydratase class I